MWEVRAGHTIRLPFLAPLRFVYIYVVFAALLSRRIIELNQEKSSQKLEYKQIKKTKSRLEREKREKEKECERLDQKCRELQMLKFGALVDLEALGAGDFNPQGVELRARLRELENRTTLAVKQANRQLVKLKRQLTDVMLENTEQQRDMVELNSANTQLQTSLTESMDSMFSDNAAQEVCAYLGREWKLCHRCPNESLLRASV